MQRFRNLVENHRDRVYSLACYLLNDREEAEDVTQDVFLRMWKNIDTLDEDRLGAWLMKVTRNACIDAHRRRSARTKLMDVNTEGRTYQHAEAGNPAPDAQTEAMEFQDNLRDAIAGLPEPHRTIVVCREINELKYDEIAGMLDMPLNTVKVYLHRARKLLRIEMRKRLDYVHG